MPVVQGEALGVGPIPCGRAYGLRSAAEHITQAKVVFEHYRDMMLEPAAGQMSAIAGRLEHLAELVEQLERRIEGVE